MVLFTRLIPVIKTGVHTAAATATAVVVDSLVDLSGYGSSAPEPEPIAAAYSAGSCCPRLRKLRLVSVVGLRSSAVARRRRSLQQFPRNRAFGVLELNTPNLRSLKMCCYAPGTLRISAPRLEELRSSNNVIDMRWQCVEQLDVGDLSCVRGLREIDLSSRGPSATPALTMAPFISCGVVLPSKVLVFALFLQIRCTPSVPK
uniref:Uncharacterized protein n=1 Tax=Oryza glumipatula TaxID=40148 RepID=A0A0E0AT44_9ORYZ